MVGRHNFFFLINFFFFFFKESYSFLYCKHVNFCYFYFNWLKSKLNTIILMNCQQNCNKLKKISKLGLIRFFSEIKLKKTLGSAWKIRVGRINGNKQLFFLRLSNYSHHPLSKRSEAENLAIQKTLCPHFAYQNCEFKRFLW